MIFGNWLKKWRERKSEKQLRAQRDFLEDFHLKVWAFGADHNSEPLERMKAWNKRHPDLFKLHEHDRISTSMELIKFYYNKVIKPKLIKDKIIMINQEVNYGMHIPTA